MAARTWRSTNWRLAWSIYLKLWVKCKKGQRHHTIMRWRRRTMVRPLESIASTSTYCPTIYIYIRNTCWYDCSVLHAYFKQQREKPKITDLDVRINIEWVPFMPFETSAHFGWHTVYLSSRSMSNGAAKEYVSQTVDCCLVAGGTELRARPWFGNLLSVWAFYSVKSEWKIRLTLLWYIYRIKV